MKILILASRKTKRELTLFIWISFYILLGKVWFYLLSSRNLGGGGFLLKIYIYIIKNKIKNFLLP